MIAARPPLPPLPRAFGAGMAEAVRRAFRQALQFGGRSPRQEFWLFALFYVLVAAVLIFVWSVIFGPTVTTAQVPLPDGRVETGVVRVSYDGGWLGFAFNLLCLVPFLALGWRRLHDRNHRGWWLLAPIVVPAVLIVAALTFFVGPSTAWFALRSARGIGVNAGPLPTLIMAVTLATYLYLLIQLIRRGTPGPNRFGPDPLEVRP